MAQAKGSSAKVVAGFEGAYKAGAGAKGTVMPRVSFSGGASRTLNTSSVVTGSRSPSAPSAGNTDYSGNIVVPVDAQTFPLWLIALFGLPTTTADGDSFKHVFTPCETQPSLWIEKQFPELSGYLLGYGIKASSLALSATSEGEVTADIGLVGAGESSNGAAAVANPAELAFMQFQNFQATVKMDGAALSDRITEFSLNLDCGLDGDSYCVGGGGERGSIAEGVLGISGNLSALFTDKTLLQKGADNTTVSFAVEYVLGATKLLVELTEAKINRASPAIDGPKGIKESYSFQGFASNPADDAIRVTVTNDVESYSLA
ncbi:phage tail tube protein [Halodesulfovibrio aestuarii]|uniref:Phage tail tube protein n=1 Tax=Halodesulfovibrio aestuarii TaxID=126333 RepID=A0ABV4JWD2_9BACT